MSVGLMKQMFRGLKRQKTAAPEQVADNFPVLEDSLKRLDDADALYHPGPYWERHRKPLERYLREHGLRNYRLGDATKQDPKYVLRRFGAGEPRVVHPKHLNERRWNELRYHFAETYGDLLGAEPLSGLSMSTAGNPGDAFEIRNNIYTSNALSFYMRYAYLCQFINFDEVSVIVEIGPGSGLQTEILHKLHPHLTSYLFDIPPQSYICSQYLKHVFPGKVLGLEDTRDMEVLPPSSAGGIYVLNSWQFPLVRELPVDLFWNAASFNEMEPNLVENYLGFVAPHARFLYLMSIMDGSRVGIEDYRRYLPRHDCVRLEPVLYQHAAMSPLYKNSFWKAKAE